MVVSMLADHECHFFRFSVRGAPANFEVVSLRDFVLVFALAARDAHNFFISDGDIEVYTIYRLASDSVFEIDNISNTDPIDSPWF
eukprot:CAMPEP_0185588302 /NCGR_PEP_ID=MMETSP0434-20130131/52527_1 /TAXON_ID=626734 ORGANISM="Favella taraikaensis, Strain Fe Narragansett Bay" /NCGR_SAMPLE_ID=MMETSP0434 /ASSEMBLY_ACC=CAM_ASM_000379 /LENGTH=84 /DNA_ID=CAMNT_0028210845 /DNA_START=266 /DNA_END=517 /DNA_ORIENTATION=-